MVGSLWGLRVEQCLSHWLYAIYSDDMVCFSFWFCFFGHSGVSLPFSRASFRYFLWSAGSYWKLASVAVVAGLGEKPYLLGCWGLISIVLTEREWSVISKNEVILGIWAHIILRSIKRHIRASRRLRDLIKPFMF